MDIWAFVRKGESERKEMWEELGFIRGIWEES